MAKKSKPEGFLFGGNRYAENEAGKIINIATGKEEESGYSKVIKKYMDEEKTRSQETQADEQEAKATKKLPPPPKVEDAVDQENKEETGPGFLRRSAGAFGAAARSIGKKTFSIMFPRLSGLLKEINDDITESAKVTQKLDTDMQGVTKELNETNNLLAELNTQMTKILGLLGQILNNGGIGSKSASSGGSMASTFIGALLGVTAGAAVGYIQNWLSSSNRTGDRITPPDIVPETPPVPERTSLADIPAVDAIPSSAQGVTSGFNIPGGDTPSSTSTAQQGVVATDQSSRTNTMAATDSQSSRSGMPSLLNSLGGSFNNSGSTTFGGGVTGAFSTNGITPVISPTLSISGTSGKENQISENIQELKTKSDTKNRDLVINADKISFNADGMLFKQNSTDEGDDQGYGGNFGGNLGGGASLGGNGGGGMGGFFPIPKPELATVKSKSGASAQVAEKYKDRFQGLIDYLDRTNPGYIKVLGGYANRANVNNPSKPSMHSYGAALDINPSENPNGTTKTTLPPEMSMIAKSFGLGWGMDWNSVKDPMHFSASPNEGGTGDIFVSSGSTLSGVETPASPPVNMVRPTIMQGSNLAKSSSPAASASSPSSAPSQTIVPLTSSPPALNTQASLPDKLKNPNIAGPVEPPDAHRVYPLWFGPAMSSAYNTSMPAGVR